MPSEQEGPGQVKSRSGHPTLSRATIVRRKDFTDDLFVLWLEPESQFPFEPGQYITIGVEGVERPYSIASAPYEPLIELFIERVPSEQGGTLTPMLHARRVGDLVTMRPRAKGRFTLRAKMTHHVMVATVTGVAPYVSMIRQSLHDRAADTGGKGGRHRFFVMHGASHCDEFVYDSEFRRLSEDHPHEIQYVSSVSRPSAARNAEWNGPVGRINMMLEECLMRWSPPKEDTVVYLCGNPGMIDDAKARLLPRGWSVAQEQYWQQPKRG
jgi:ferredoxin/flavodoxin---NADP+ reductase